MSTTINTEITEIAEKSSTRRRYAAVAGTANVGRTMCCLFLIVRPALACRNTRPAKQAARGETASRVLGRSLLRFVTSCLRDEFVSVLSVVSVVNVVIRFPC